jgi:PAS domain S-box-containing protein
MLKTHNILIVEDDIDLLRITSKTLRDEGYKVDIAEDARQCLDKVSEFQPDFLIVDYGLPDQTGVSLISEIYKKLPSKLPGILVVSGFRSDDSFIDNVLDKGAVDFIRKPFKSKELTRRVNSYFKIRDLENKRLALLKEYRAVMDLSGELVFHLDGELKFVHLNKAFESLTKHSISDYIQKSPKGLIYEGDWPAFKEECEKVMEGNDAQVFEIRVVRKDDSKFPVSIRLSSLSNELGEVSVVGVGQDMSNLKWLHDAEKNTKKNSNSINVKFGINEDIRKQTLNQRILKKALNSFSRLVSKSVENRVYRLDQDISREISGLATMLGENLATPRDVINLHTGFLKRIPDETHLRKADVISDESRIILLKLMGTLAMYYRSECIKN